MQKGPRSWVGTKIGFYHVDHENGLSAISHQASSISEQWEEHIQPLSVVIPRAVL